MSARALAFALGLALSASAVGCGHTETHVAMLRAASPPVAHEVEIYLAQQPLPMRRFSEVALVQAVGFGDEAETEAVIEALRKRAGQTGCDAVTRVYVDVGYARAHAAGVCVRWLGPPVAGAPRASGALPVAGPKGSLLGPTAVPKSPTPRPEPLPSQGGAGGN